VRELLGKPSRIEHRPKAEVWDYEHPFAGVTELRIVFGERKRVAWSSMSGPDLDMDFP
jgi:hypothetical protein